MGMKVFFIIIFFFSHSLLAQESLVGTWKFTDYIYNGQTLPAPNPNLDLRFSFDQKGFSFLKWFRTDEAGFCERLATYKTKTENWLYQKTVWINPSNDPSCANDLEMHLGYETITAFKVQDRKLFLELSLNGEPFIYILTAVE